MSIRYSNAAFTTMVLGETRTGLVDNLRSELINAGWSHVSGSSGDWKLNSGITAAGHQIRIRLYDPGTGNVCARMRLMNVTETIAPEGDMFVAPATGRLFRLLANPYQFFLLVPGTIEPRTFLACGIPWLPGFVTPQFVGWAQCNVIGDWDTSYRESFRASSSRPRVEGAMQACIYGTTGWAADGGSGSQMIPYLYNWSDASAQTWPDDSRLVYEPLIAWGLGGRYETARIVGQLWDAIVVTGDWPMDAVINFDGRQWYAVYHRRDSSGALITLAVLTPTS